VLAEISTQTRTLDLLRNSLSDDPETQKKIAARQGAIVADLQKELDKQVAELNQELEELRVRLR
jgi:ubiquinone biosynthesis protein Coq4